VLVQKAGREIKDKGEEEHLRWLEYSKYVFKIRVPFSKTHDNVEYG